MYSKEKFYAEKAVKATELNKNVFKKKDGFLKANFKKTNILKPVIKAIKNFSLLKSDDRILLGLSGGKDSLVLAHVFLYFQKRLASKFTFKAVFLMYGVEGEKKVAEMLQRHCLDYGINFEAVNTDIFNIVKEKYQKNKTPCSFFATMRRGFFYQYAQENNFNKVAFGHHLDDAAETLLMSIFYNGSIRSMAPKYKTKYNVEMIRPLAYVREKENKKFCKKNDFNVIGDEICPGMTFSDKIPHTRKLVKKILQEMENENPHLFNSIAHALGSIDEDSLYLSDVKKIESDKRKKFFENFFEKFFE